jgi:hypothetical protein
MQRNSQDVCMHEPREGKGNQRLLLVVIWAWWLIVVVLRLRLWLLIPSRDGEYSVYLGVI